MVNTEIRLIMFFEAKDGEAVYSQQNQDLELTVSQNFFALIAEEGFLISSCYSLELCIQMLLSFLFSFAFSFSSFLSYL